MVHILGTDPLGVEADIQELDARTTQNASAISQLQSSTPNQGLNEGDSPTFASVTVTNGMTPANDDISDAGQPAKRFKTVYCTDIVTQTINGQSIFTSNQPVNTTSDVVFNDVTVTGNVNGPVSIINGDLNMNIRKIVNLATPTVSADATTKNYVDTQAGQKLNLTGGTLTGQLECQDIIPSATSTFTLGTTLRKFADVKSTNATIDGLSCTTGDISATPTVGTSITNKTYVDTQRDTRLALSGGVMTGGITNLRTTDNTILIGSNASAPAATKGVQIGENSTSQGLFNVTIGINTQAGTGSDNVCIGTGARATGTCFACTVVGKDSGAGVASINNCTVVGSSAAVAGATAGSTYIGSNAGLNAGGFTKVVIINGTEASCNPTANNQIRIAAGSGASTVIEAVPSELRFASGVISAKQSWMESWWAHNSMQTTAMVTNTATTQLRVNTATSFYFSPNLATAGLNSMVPIVLNTTPVIASNGVNFPTEWVQTLVPIAVAPTNPSTTTGGNRVQYTYSGPAARRFNITIMGTYQTASGSAFIVYQGLMRTVSSVTSFINGTASSWFETDANRVFLGVSKKILLVNPGDVFEVAVGYDPLLAPNQNNIIIARDMTITFHAMLNST